MNKKVLSQIPHPDPGPESHPSFNAFFRPDRLRDSILSQGGAQIFKLLVSIFISGWTARYLGPQNFGILSYVAALVGLLGPLGNLGMKGSLSALLCEEPLLPGLLGSALFIELIGTFLMALVLIPFAISAKDPMVAGLISLAILGNIFSSSEVFEAELLNQQRGTKLALVGTIQTTLGACFSIFALVAQLPLFAFGILPAFQSIVRAGLLMFSVQYINISQLLKEASWKTCFLLIKRGWPLLLSALSVILYMRIDQVMLEWLRGPADVGQYSVAIRVSESLYFLPMIFANTFMPRIAKTSENFKQDQSLCQLYRGAWLIGVVIVLITSFVLPIFTLMIFGDQYIDALNALKILAIGGFAVSTGVASSVWLNRMGGELLRVIPLRTFVAMTANIALNLWLIPDNGIYGAAVATSISYFIATFGVLLVFSSSTRNNAFFLMLPI